MALRRFAQDFDLCLIDTPPPGSLAAADFVVTPVSVGLYVADSEAKYNLLNIFGSVKE